jgi:hypothetical protein
LKAILGNQFCYHGKGVLMPSQSSQVLPSSFDPAIHLHAGPLGAACCQTGYSDDAEALNVVQEEQRAGNAEKGFVIQHRAWNLRDVFHSEDGGWFSAYRRLILSTFTKKSQTAQL